MRYIIFISLTFFSTYLLAQDKYNNRENLEGYTMFIPTEKLKKEVMLQNEKYKNSEKCAKHKVITTLTAEDTDTTINSEDNFELAATSLTIYGFDVYYKYLPTGKRTYYFVRREVTANE